MGMERKEFLKDLSGFYGTGEKNISGQTLEEFLQEYDPYKYKTPSCTTDAVIFAYEGEECRSLCGLKILLVKRRNHPSIGFWALPGGFIDLNENLEDTARRELWEETGVKDLAMEQVATYGDFDRDPRTRVITTAYMALVAKKDVKIRAGDDAADAAWCDVRLLQRQTEKRRHIERDIYVLDVKNSSRNLDTQAIVEVCVSDGLIREEKFSVREQGMIAVDHAAIIVQSLLKLSSRF